MNHEQKKQQTERVNERNKKRIRVKVKVRVRDKMKTPEERNTENNNLSEICIWRRHKNK